MPDPLQEQGRQAGEPAKGQPDLFRQEARRLAQLSARDRKEALAVHRRIADDPRLSEATRQHARYVADTLEKLIARMRKKN
jgi:hypothetical protein